VTFTSSGSEVLQVYVILAFDCSFIAQGTLSIPHPPRLTTRPILLNSSSKETMAPTTSSSLMM
jgi:hypothetical protein